MSHDGRRLRAPVRSGAGLATTVVRALDAAGISVDDVEVHQPSLDDVFFALTGHPAEEPRTTPRAPTLEPSHAELEAANSMTVTALLPRTGRHRWPARRDRRAWSGRPATSWSSPGATWCTSPASRLQLSDVTVQPVLFTLLFVYVFGAGVVLPGGGTYADFAIAGLLALNLTTSSMGTAVGLSTDLNSGVIDRFRTLPMWRPAVLVGRSLADLATAAICAAIVAVTGLCHRLADRAAAWPRPLPVSPSSSCSPTPCRGAAPASAW